MDRGFIRRLSEAWEVPRDLLLRRYPPFVTGGPLRFPAVRFGLLRPFGIQGFGQDGEAEGAALPLDAVDPDGAAHQLDELPGDGQAQPGPLVFVLGAEIRIENAVDNRWTDARTGIRHGQSQMLTRLQIGIGQRRYFIFGQAIQGDRQSPAIFLHCMVGIGAQIHDNLMHLGGIGKHRSAILFEIVADLYIRRKRCPDQVQHLFDYKVKFKRPLIHINLSAEGQDLLDQVFSPGGGVPGQSLRNPG